MILFSSCIVSMCSICFIGEVSQPEFLAVGADCSEPFLLTLAERNTPVLRVGIRFVASAVAGVLGGGSWPEVGLSIVEGVSVSVVNEEVGPFDSAQGRWGIAFDCAQAEQDLPVHQDGFQPASMRADDASGVKIVVPSAGEPTEGV